MGSEPRSRGGAVGPLSGLDELADVVGPLARRFCDAGHRIFLVGGVVRDLVVAGDAGRPLSGGDIDLTTDARPPAIKALLRPMAEVVWDQGERFGTIGARVSGRSLEITTHRAEAYDPESRKPTVSFGDDIGGDLERRDFTINAAAVELPGGELHDPHGGLADLRNRVLRTPLSPEISFTDDPLRMLRAARFIPRFDLEPAPELVVAATELAPRLEIVSVERVADELERLLRVAEPLAGFEFLVRTGLLSHLLPALASPGPAEGSTVDVAVALASASAREPESGREGAAGAEATGALVRRAGLLWPVRDRAEAELARLRYSRAETTRTVRLLAAADDLLAGGALADALPTAPDPATIRRLAIGVGADGLDSVIALVANLAAVGEASAGAGSVLAEAVGQLRAGEALDDLDGPLSGEQVMGLLRIGPGPEVGRALAIMRELRIERGPIAPEDAGRELLARWSRTLDGPTR